MNLPYNIDVFQNKTYRQVVGEMLDNVFEVLKLYIAEWAQNGAPPTHSAAFHDELAKSQKDLYSAIGFFIGNYESIMKKQNKESRFLRGLLHELKHFRNNWAHSKDFTMREIYRIQDTIQMVFDELNLSVQSTFYQKGSLMRDVASVKLGEESKQKLTQVMNEQQQNFQQQQLLQHQQQQLAHQAQYIQPNGNQGNYFPTPNGPQFYY